MSTIPCVRWAYIFKICKGHGYVLEVIGSLGHHFLDDGLGGDRSFESALQSSRYVRHSIQEFWFLFAEEKCDWLPRRQVTWLGYFMCMDSGKSFITEDRIKRLEFTCKSVLYQLGTQKSRILPARFAASLTVQVISMQFYKVCQNALTCCSYS